MSIDDQNGSEMDKILNEMGIRVISPANSTIGDGNQQSGSSISIPMAPPSQGKSILWFVLSATWSMIIDHLRKLNNNSGHTNLIILSLTDH